ncbi:MAG: NUDIX hydrolase [Patescibacteria group bacterium]
MNKVFQGLIFSVWQWEQVLFDGSNKIFERVIRPDATRVIGVLPDKRIILTWDEQPHREGVLTPAGGQLDEGEELETGAAREFFEETGYRSVALSPWFTSKGMGGVSFTVHFFIAKNCEKVSEPQNSAGEKTEVRLFTFDEFVALGQNETLRDLQLRIMLLEALLDPKKKEALYKLLYE